MSTEIVKKNFIKFDFIKNSIRIIYNIMYEVEVADKQLTYIAALFLCELEKKPFVSQYCLNILRRNLSSEVQKTDISNYITLLKKKKLIGYKDKEVKFPGGFKHIGKNSFNVNLTCDT